MTINYVKDSNFCSILWVISMFTSEFSIFLMLAAITP